MKDRIMLIMEKESMTQQEFATALEISPSSLSSIFNGRTNPTNNHVQAVHRRFPNINISWLMFGEGEMYIDEEPEPKKNTSSATEAATLPFEGSSPYTGGEGLGGAVGPLPGMPVAVSGGQTDAEGGNIPFQTAVPVIRETIKYIDKPQRRITEIRIFFDDGTFETFQGTK